MRLARLAVATLPILLIAACNQEADTGTAHTSVVADANGADSMASNDGAPPANPDVEARPLMQAQVVLERLGFGPGVIDGEMGLSTENALSGFQEANALAQTGKLDAPTQAALARWSKIPATRVVMIPKDWGSEPYAPLPKDPAAQAKLAQLGYGSLDERLAERFHTKIDVLLALNPGGHPAKAGETAAAPTPTASSSPSEAIAEHFTAGQIVRVPNIGSDWIDAAEVDNQAWLGTLRSLGVGTRQPSAAHIVVDKSGGWLKAYDKADRLIAMFTVTTGSSHDPLPLGDWKINGVSRNPDFAYDPDLFWDVADSKEEQRLPPGPNGPVGVVWIDLSKPHYGIHGTPAPETIGRSESHGCVRLTNWDAARLAGMVDGSTKVHFQA